MLSYRHAFHAGNHADVLKHAVLCILLDHYTQKEKPFTCVDTHAGAGLYRLDSDWAQTTLEAQGGIVQLLEKTEKNQDSLPVPLYTYIKTARHMSASFQYPGSPELERLFCRSGDRVVLCELHPAEILLLRENMKGDSRVHIHSRSGFEFLAGAILPARSCVLIDPSYETDADYNLVFESIKKALRRNLTATYAVWYPLVRRRTDETANLLRLLQNLHEKEKNMGAELFYSEKKENEHGLYGSGMFVINAPWKCAEKTKETLLYIGSALNMKYRLF